MSARLTDLHPDVEWAARWALYWANYYGVPVQVTSTFRTCFEQARLYTNYRQGRSPYPANPPGESAHNYGLAWDSTVAPAFQSWWDYVRRFYFHVPSNDRIHAEVPAWRQYVIRPACT